MLSAVFIIVIVDIKVLWWYDKCALNKYRKMHIL